MNVEQAPVRRSPVGDLGWPLQRAARQFGSAEAIVDCELEVLIVDRDQLEVGRALRQRCGRRLWRAQHFSWWMTQMLHVDPRDDDYGRALQTSQLEYVCSSVAAATSLAENHVGLALERIAAVTAP